MIHTLFSNLYINHQHKREWVNQTTALIPEECSQQFPHILRFLLVKCPYN
ncbi:hypothetical protein SBDP2_1940008 [Syntrophobacter sp. SbD2]|nr:hypothetical protein SBDP2_1940008 [Syntrophobacter sp. SbD2]